MQPRNSIATPDWKLVSEWPSRAARSFSASAEGVKGFCRSATPLFNTPWWMAAFSVQAEAKSALVVFQMQNADGKLHSLLVLPFRSTWFGGGSLMAAQKTPNSLTAFIKSWKSTGFTTKGLTPNWYHQPEPGA